MGKSYATEIKALTDSLAWAHSSSICDMQRFVRECYGTPLVAVGSGGSAAAAHFAALLHRRIARGASRHATPLEVLLDGPASHNSSVLFLSASGKNADVIAAARAAVAAEVSALGVVCMRVGSPLASHVRAYARGFVLDNPIPTGKDGYLATNSLLATLVIIARAYGSLAAPVEPRPPKVDDGWWGRDSVVILHGGWSSPVATDLESRMHESALLHAQITDYRNFGHGRHLWLAQRHASTFVLALVTPETAVLASKTLQLLPVDVPVVKLSTEQSGPTGTIDLLVKALHWTLAVADHLGVDPGKPRVPDFGRRMFHLSPPRRAVQESASLAAVDRKLERVGLESTAARQLYTDENVSFRAALADVDLGAVVLDYDGTLVHQAKRYDPLPESIADALKRILKMGLLLGIATGRGRSVREALRARLPSTTWDAVYVGYYNGADVGTLADDVVPDRSRPTSEAITKVAKVLRDDRLLATVATLEVRPSQVTVTQNDAEQPVELYRHLTDLLSSAALPGVRILRSAHSYDIIETGTSKLAVVRRIAGSVSPRVILCIGDKGAWPGNDVELLGHRFSLSVDEVSSAPQSCWNLSPRGCIGPSATLRYLDAIEFRSGVVRVNVGAIERPETSA